MSEAKYWNMIDYICDELRHGRIYKVESAFRKILVRVLKYHNCKDNRGDAFTFSSVKKRLDEKHKDEYRGMILRLAELSNYSRDIIDQVVRTTINTMFSSGGTPVDVFNGLPFYFMEDNASTHAQSESSNVIPDLIEDNIIQVSTIHKVKGETHDATLYLETVNNRKSDLERIIPHYKGTKAGATKVDQYSRKCAYVGFSRPRKFLCVAMRVLTYEEAWKDFAGWEVYDCRDNS